MKELKTTRRKYFEVVKMCLLNAPPLIVRHIFLSFFFVFWAIVNPNPN